MKAVLHPYQETAAGWLRERPEAALLLDMGLGKTLIALTALVDLATVGEDVWPALVIAPLMTARHVWPAEVAKWDHTRHLRRASSWAAPPSGRRPCGGRRRSTWSTARTFSG